MMKRSMASGLRLVGWLTTPSCRDSAMDVTVSFRTPTFRTGYPVTDVHELVFGCGSAALGYEIQRRLHVDRLPVEKPPNVVHCAPFHPLQLIRVAHSKSGDNYVHQDE